MALRFAVLRASGRGAAVELLEDEMLRSMALLGVSAIEDLGRSYLHPATPVTTPSSAPFRLLIIHAIHELLENN